MKLNKQNNFSSFWLGDSLENKSLIEKDVDTKPGVDHIKLAGYQRAISNFVNIVTSKSIPVQFSQRGDSYTDGKVVTISSKLDDKLFDSSVGLALHEGSHILLSDFDFLRQLGSSIPKTTYELGMSKGMRQRDIKEFFNKSGTRTFSNQNPNYLGLECKVKLKCKHLSSTSWFFSV